MIVLKSTTLSFRGKALEGSYYLIIEARRNNRNRENVIYTNCFQYYK